MYGDGSTCADQEDADGQVNDCRLKVSKQNPYQVPPGSTVTGMSGLSTQQFQGNGPLLGGKVDHLRRSIRHLLEGGEILLVLESEGLLPEP